MANKLLHQGKDGPFWRNFTHWWVIRSDGTLEYRKVKNVQLVLADGHGTETRALFEIHQRAPGLKRPFLFGLVVGVSFLSVLLAFVQVLSK